jgi:hypothetical protein
LFTFVVTLLFVVGYCSLLLHTVHTVDYVRLVVALLLLC